MKKDSRIHLFWDSCVFIRYLLNEPGAEFVQDISQYIDDAMDGSVQIHFSTIALAEIKPSHLIPRGYGDMNEFFADFRGAFSPIGPSPDVLMRAGSLRDFSYPNPNGGPDRIMGTADAIHLMTCVHAREDLDLPNIVFQTMDDGGHRNWEGKCVPLLSFDKWTAGIPKNFWVPKVCDLPREKPAHPEIRLFIG